MTEGIRTVGTVQWFLPKAGQACFRPKLTGQACDPCLQEEYFYFLISQEIKNSLVRR